jgi:hypothetical protein
MQTEEAENSGDSIPLSTGAVLHISAMVENSLIYDHTRAYSLTPGFPMQEVPGR